MKHVNESIIPFILLTAMIYIIIYIALNSLLLTNGKPYLPHNVARFLTAAESKSIFPTIELTGSNKYNKKDSLFVIENQYSNWFDLKREMTGEQVIQILGTLLQLKRE
ncbi:MAG: hypothetical protein V1773_19165 [bacterium]